MADTTIKAVNPIITILPLPSAVTSRDAGNSNQNVLALLSDGSIVSGFVINRDTSGNPVLRTPQGDFTVNSDVFIKTGSEVTLRVDSSQSTNARIITIDNLTPEEYSTQTTRGLTEDTITPPTLTSAMGTTTLNASPIGTLAPPVLQALVLQANAQRPTLAGSAIPATAATIQPASLPPALAQLVPGTPIVLTVLDVKLPPTPIALSTMPEAPAS